MKRCLFATAVCLAFTTVVPASAAAPASLAQAATVAEPSVVMIATTVSADIQDSRYARTYAHADGTPFSALIFGAGFFVTNDGYILTSSDLLSPSPSLVKTALVAQYIVQDAHDPSIGDCDAIGNCDALIAANQDIYLQASTLVNVKTTVHVLTQDTTDVKQALVATTKATSGGAALLKVTLPNSPSLLINPAAAPANDAVNAIGFGQATSAGTVPPLTPVDTAATLTAKGLSTTLPTNSAGGPLIDAGGYVAGMATATGVTPATALRQLLQQAAVNNGQGRIDQLWRTGMDDYTAQQYSDAQTAFSECIALQAAQVGCSHYNDLAVAAAQNIATAKINPLLRFAPAIAGGIAVVLGLGITGLVVRARRRGKYAQPIRYVRTSDGRPALDDVPRYTSPYSPTEQPQVPLPTRDVSPITPFTREVHVPQVSSSSPIPNAPLPEPAQRRAAPVLAFHLNASDGEAVAVMTSLTTTPKFCGECGAQLAGVVVCSECGFSWQ